MQQGGMLFVENPAAHLHPFSKSRIGAFLAVIASTGRQVWVETHSDHVVNGIRLAVSKGLVAPEKANFTFFRQPANGDTATASQIRMLANGRLERWPKGFFDQIERDLAEL
jgi:predicted ATPase